MWCNTWANPFANRGNLPRLDRGGIFHLATTGVTLTSTSVDYGIRPCQWRALPSEGLILLKVRHATPAGGAALPVNVAIPGGSSSTTIPVVSHNNTPVTGGNIVSPSERWVYYNKCNGTFRFLEFTNTPTPVA